MVSIKRILHLLFNLAALIGLLPVLPFLDLWVQVVLLMAFLLGIAGERSTGFLLSNRLATLLSAAFFLLFLTQATLVNLVSPLIHLLSLLLAVRLASEKTARHILQLFMLATIVLAASSMLTLDIFYLVYLILLVLLVTSGLVLLSFYATDPQISFGRQQWSLLIKTTGLLPAGSLILMLVLFVILPRTQTPLWNFLNPEPVAVIGMSDKVRPGSVAELSQSAQTAFRAETERLPDDALYWRGIVLNRLEGQTWVRSEAIAVEKPLSDPTSETLVKIYSEPKAERFLVTLDYPRQVEQIRHESQADGVVKSRWNANRKVSYLVRAQYRARSRQIGDPVEYLQLPAKLSIRLRDVGSQIAMGKNYSDKIDLLEAFFLQQQLSYASSQLPVTENPLDTFLFDSRRGYCEYFASSFALLLRLAGVPARLVGGYLGGEYNQIGGYYLVGEETAHVWVEALDDDGVWQRIDPSHLAINAEQALLASRRQGLASFRALADTLLHNWSRLVLNYDLRQQFSLIRQVAGQVRALKQMDSRSLLKTLWLLPLLLPVVLILFWQQRKNRSERLLRSYRRRVAKIAGLPALPPELGLFDLASQSGDPLCLEFAEVYGGALYRDLEMSAADYRRLKQIIAQLAAGSAAIEVALPAALSDNGAS